MELTTLRAEFECLSTLGLCIRGLPAVNPPWDTKAGLKWARFVLNCLWHTKFEVYAAQVCCVAKLSRQVSSTLEEGGSVFPQNVATPWLCDRTLHYSRPRSRLQRYRFPFLILSCWQFNSFRPKELVHCWHPALNRATMNWNILLVSVTVCTVCTTGLC